VLHRRLPEVPQDSQDEPNAAVDPAVDGKEHPRVVPLTSPHLSYVDGQSFFAHLSTAQRHNSPGLWKKREEIGRLAMEFPAFTVFTDQELSKVALAAQTVGL
jgi:hypothetical protein